MTSPDKSLPPIGPAALDRHSPNPLWAQLLDDLRRRLRSGEFIEAFPTDIALMGEYDVSRQTVREAMRRLVAEGAVERQRGRGSRIRQAEFAQPLGSLYSLFRVIEAAGVRQTSLVRALDERIDAAAASQLGLPSTADLIYLERVRLAGGRPLALDQAWLPADLARPLLHADFSHTALYDELLRRCHIGPEGGTEQIRPVIPTPAQRSALNLARSEAAFAIERHTWATGRPLEVRHTLVRGDRFALAAQWEDAGTIGDAPPLLRLLPMAAGAEDRR